MTPLRSLEVADFLRRHWQKKPLAVRNALPECANILQREGLIELATRDDLESRLVERSGRRWRVRHGPFGARELRRLPRSGWTLLVQGVDTALPAARELLDRFSFIPYARLDDVMASYAPAGGGVGPHFDQYDVFLLQGEGRRRWRVGRQRDLELVANAPLKILRRFRPSREWLMEPGDLLYLPPRYAHDGVAASGGCVTFSIGFRAPGARELGARFLDWLQDRLRIEGEYADPDLRMQGRPALLGEAMTRKARKFLDGIRWDDGEVTRFLGCHLTEPKAHVVMPRPVRPLAARAFAARASRDGVGLALQTRMLFRGRTIFINGEACDAGAPAARLLARLADRRRLPPRSRVDRESADLLYRWYRAGYLHFGDG
jgi:50S ribosomal protein L16 3-hydroxylase